MSRREKKKPRDKGESPTLKTINYRGGVVRFRIPTDWVEEYEQAGGGGTFYKPGDNDGGTLRLEMILAVARPGKPVTAEFIAELLRAIRRNMALLPARLAKAP